MNLGIVGPLLVVAGDFLVYPSWPARTFVHHSKVLAGRPAAGNGSTGNGVTGDGVAGHGPVDL